MPNGCENMKCVHYLLQLRYLLNAETRFLSLELVLNYWGKVSKYISPPNRAILFVSHRPKDVVKYFFSSFFSFILIHRINSGWVSEVLLTDWRTAISPLLRTLSCFFVLFCFYSLWDLKLCSRENCWILVFRVKHQRVLLEL